jgi:Trk K+ transport system NAD-binding subunit
MAESNRRPVFYLGLVVVTTLGFTLVYNVGMAVWEGQSQPLYRSLQIVIQSLTTTGYGEDAPWQSLPMNLLVITMQFAGIGLILTAVDVFAVPWLRDALTPTAPERIPGVEDHVIVCAHTPRTEAFITELDARDREYVLVEPDPDTARDLHGEEYQVVHGDPTSTATFENAGIDSAVAVVADAADDTNASIALTARDTRSDVRVITLVEDAELARYHRAAGADEVLSPRQLLGGSLARELPTAVTTDIEDSITIGDDFEIVELTVSADSELSGQTFTEAQLRQRFGVNVIGAWFDSDFETPVDQTDTLEADTRLLVTGETDRVEALREATTSTIRQFSGQKVLLAGYGDSGQAAADALAQTSTTLTVLDIEDGDAVDVVGDARDPSVLERAGIADASALVLTVADDTTAIFATLIARDLNPDLWIVVRANEEADVKKLYRAGADYVQSLATISGRMLDSTVFEDKELLAYEKRVSVVRTTAPGLAGQTLTDADVRSVTGCTVVTIVSDGETVTEFDPHTFEFSPDDEVIIAGRDEDVTRFEQEFGG